MRLVLMRRLLAMLPFFLLPAAALPAQSTAFPGFDVVGTELGVSSLTAADVRDVFRGDRALWPSGEGVTVVLPSGRSSYGEAFAKAVLGMTRETMQRYWLGLVFQGRAAPPVNLGSVAEVLAYVERTPGAIAVVPAGAAPRSLVIPVR